MSEIVSKLEISLNIPSDSAMGGGTPARHLKSDLKSYLTLVLDTILDPRGLGWVNPQVPRRRGGRRTGAEEQGQSPRGCHGAGAVAARVPRRRGECRAGATEGLGAARVPRRGWAPRECHRGGGGRRAGATEGAGRRAGATVSLLIQSPPLGISYPLSTGLRLASKN